MIRVARMRTRALLSLLVFGSLLFGALSACEPVQSSPDYWKPAIDRWPPGVPQCVDYRDGGQLIAAPPLYLGESSLEQRIFKYPTIVRAHLDRVTASAVPAGVDDAWGFVNIVRFHLKVSEYLSGAGPDSIVAVWGSYCLHVTRAAADAARPYLMWNRDTSFDDREAVFFLSRDFWELFEAAREDDAYEIGFADYFLYEDFMSLHSRHVRRWLPAAESEFGAGDDKKYLLALPETPADQAVHGRITTLGALRERIAAVHAEINAGDGSDEYLACLRNKILWDAHAEYFRSEGREPNHRIRDATHRTASGQPAGTVVYTSEMGGSYPDLKSTRTWLEGDDADLFQIVDGPLVGVDVDHDGELSADWDRIEYYQSLRSRRPLPAGTYEFAIRDRSNKPAYHLCRPTATYPWTVVAEAPEDVLHEAFFDPVLLADGALGVVDGRGTLAPDAFDWAGGAAVTLEEIVWEAGQVRVRVSPPDALVGQILEFIALDGTVALTLDVAEAEVDGVGGLIWRVSQAPWRGGQKLMLRVRQKLPSAPAPGRLTARPAGPVVFGLLWHPVGGAAGYQVQHRAAGEAVWRTLDSDVTGTAFAAVGPDCATAHEFRVGAYGDDQRYDGRVGYWSAAASIACPEFPIFGSAGNVFEVGAEAPAGTPVGVVAAIDPAGNQPSYLIVSGNGDGAFNLAADSGTLTVAGPLDNGRSHVRNLTIAITNGRGGTFIARIPVAVSPVCRNGVVIDSLVSNVRLVEDCIVLYYGVRAKLGGTARLDWSADRSMTDWLGVSLGGTWWRVRGLTLWKLGLDGIIPAELGSLTALKRLDLFGNELTGAVPAELAELDLERLQISGNDLSGCLPAGLDAVPENDLRDTGLDHCIVAGTVDQNP